MITHGDAHAGRRKFMAWLDDRSGLDTVREAAQLAGLPEDEIRSGGIAAALDYLTSQPAPASLLVDVSGCDDVIDAMNRLADACEPGTRVVALGSVNDIDAYRQMLDLGVTEYLVKPSTAEAIARALNRTRAANARQESQPKAFNSIAVIGTRGGCGATSVAVSAACALAHQHNLKTLLIDLDLQLGSAAMSLDLEPSRGLREILSNADRIDSLLIKSALVRESDQLSILSAEEPLESALDIDGQALKSLLKWVEEDRDVVVMDVSRRLDGLARAALDECEIACVVTDLSLAAMRDSKRILALLARDNPDKRTILVANRVGGVAGEVPQAEFERGIGANFDFVLPFDAKASVSAADEGKSLLAAADPGPFHSEFNHLIGLLAGAEAAPTQQAPRAWFKRLIGS